MKGIVPQLRALEQHYLDLADVLVASTNYLPTIGIKIDKNAGVPLRAASPQDTCGPQWGNRSHMKIVLRR